jgi:hypothetical protein
VVAALPEPRGHSCLLRTCAFSVLLGTFAHARSANGLESLGQLLTQTLQVSCLVPLNPTSALFYCASHVTNFVSRWLRWQLHHQKCIRLVLFSPESPQQSSLASVIATLINRSPIHASSLNSRHASFVHALSSSSSVVIVALLSRCPTPFGFFFLLVRFLALPYQAPLFKILVLPNICLSLLLHNIPTTNILN